MWLVKFRSGDVIMISMGHSANIHAHLSIVTPISLLAQRNGPRTKGQDLRATVRDVHCAVIVDPNGTFEGSSPLSMQWIPVVCLILGQNLKI